MEIKDLPIGHACVYENGSLCFLDSNVGNFKVSALDESWCREYTDSSLINVIPIPSEEFLLGILTWQTNWHSTPFGEIIHLPSAIRVKKSDKWHLNKESVSISEENILVTKQAYKLVKALNNYL